jgi:streptogramin lyase
MFTDPSISAPVDVSAGPDGNIWFTNYGNDSIGRVTPGGTVTSFTDSRISEPTGITAGPDGNLWFTNAGNDSIGRITTTGDIETFTDPSISSPGSIVASPQPNDGALFFVNQGTSSVGRITVSGAVSAFDDSRFNGVESLVPGPDGYLWYTTDATTNESIGKLDPRSGSVVARYQDAAIADPTGLALADDSGNYTFWFTNQQDESIGQITLSGAVTRYTDASLDEPSGIAAGPDGSMWFTNYVGASIGRIGTGYDAVPVTSFPVSDDFHPFGITVGSDGNMWFTTGEDSIGRMTLSGSVSYFTSPGILGVTGVTTGPDGNVWFTSLDTGLIGRITPAGEITTFPVGGAPTAIAAGPDGNLWFTDANGTYVGGPDSIGRITPTGTVARFTNSTISNPGNITAGPDGNLWFANQDSGSIGWITPSGVIGHFASSKFSGVDGIAAGPDGNIWYTTDDSTNQSIGKFDPLDARRTITRYTGPEIQTPTNITPVPDGNLWFTNQQGNSIGRITPDGVVTTFIGSGISEPSGIVAGPDGNLWFTNYEGPSGIGRISANVSLVRANDLADGGSLATGAVASPTTPVQTSATLPSGGDIEIAAAPTSLVPAGYTAAGNQIVISASDASPTDPLRIVFRVDQSSLASLRVAASTMPVFRDGALVPDCTNPTEAIADPDPCVFERVTLGDGDAEIGVYTSRNSIWNFGARTQQIKFTTVPPKTYGAKPFAVHPTATSRLPVSVTSATPAVCGVSGTTVSVLAAGECTLHADQAGNTTFAAAPTVTQSFTVNPRKLTVSVSASSRAYGTADPAFVLKYRGFVNGDSTATAVSGSPSCHPDATQSSSPGTYIVTCTTGTVSAPNYALVFTSGKLKIVKAVLTVTADDYMRPVGAANPPSTATMSGFTDGESLPTSDVTGAPTCTTKAKPVSPAGSYAIHCVNGTLASTDYKFVFVNGILIVS